MGKMGLNLRDICTIISVKLGDLKKLRYTSSPLEPFALSCMLIVTVVGKLGQIFSIVL